MGLFNNYLKEGPGVDKDAKKKKGVFLYFDIVFAKFFKLIQANFMTSLISLPYFLILFLFMSPFVMRAFGLDTVIEEAGLSGLFKADDMFLYQLVVQSMISVVLFNFLGSGPVSASYAYITRCYTRAEHAWIMSDGKDKFKENFKNSALLLITDIVVIFLIMNAIYFYGQYAITKSGALAMLFLYIKFFTILMFVIYMMMHIYAYQIMVTYECTFKNLIKSSFMLTMAKLPMNVILTAISASLIVIPMYFGINPLIAVLFYMIIGRSFTRFPLEFYAARVIEKNIKATQNDDDKNEAEPEEEKIFEDNLAKRINERVQ